MAAAAALVGQCMATGGWLENLQYRAAAGLPEIPGASLLLAAAGQDLGVMHVSVAEGAGVLECLVGSMAARQYLDSPDPGHQD